MISARNGRPHFQISERIDDNGALCVSLAGELDLAVADDLATRLEQLEQQGRDVRLDLAQLDFIDSTGIRELIRAIDASRQNGAQLTIGTRTTPAVRRVIDLVGVGPHFWPLPHRH